MIFDLPDPAIYQLLVDKKRTPDENFILQYTNMYVSAGTFRNDLGTQTKIRHRQWERTSKVWRENDNKPRRRICNGAATYIPVLNTWRLKEANEWGFTLWILSHDWQSSIDSEKRNKSPTAQQILKSVATQRRQKNMDLRFSTATKEYDKKITIWYCAAS